MMGKPIAIPSSVLSDVRKVMSCGQSPACFAANPQNAEHSVLYLRGAAVAFSNSAPVFARLPRIVNAVQL